MPFWVMLDTGLGIFLTMAVLGLILTHSGEFVAIVSSAGSTTTGLFKALSFQA